MMIVTKLCTIVFVIFGSISCWRYRDPEPLISSFPTSYRPILMSRTLLENSISTKPARTIVEAGKIYLYGNYILINEKYKGFHVIDNKNDSLPINIGFINVPGSLDMAIKSNILYVDNSTDLVAIDVADIKTLR